MGTCEGGERRRRKQAGQGVAEWGRSWEWELGYCPLWWLRGALLQGPQRWALGQGVRDIWALLWEVCVSVVEAFGEGASEEAFVGACEGPCEAQVCEGGVSER